jgi:hypothetical protein
MNSTADEPVTIPTEWPRKLYPPAPQYFHGTLRRDGVELREQTLARYRKDKKAWIAKVRAWRDARPEYVAAYNRWWWNMNRNEARLEHMRAYTRAWRAAKQRASEREPSTAKRR